MSYPYEDLGDEQFERLTVSLCRKLMGAGVQRFAAGPDGGRDARFHGTAERFPSTAAGWVGKTVIQAKHTNGFNMHFADAAFSSDAQSSVLSEEIEKIRKLVLEGELDNYALFSNRRLGAITNSQIVARLSQECNLPPEGIFLCGVELLDDYLTEFPEVIRNARLDPVDQPLVVSSSDLAEVVLALAAGIDAVDAQLDVPPVARVSYVEKNRINKMSDAYAKALQRNYLNDTQQVQEFLANPMNREQQLQYEAAVDEFALKIIAKRRDYQTFDDVFNYLLDLLFARDSVLASNKRLTRVMLFYMYWHCDIGETADA